MAKLANSLARFPSSTFLRRLTIGLVPLVIGIYFGKWIFWVGVILSGVLSYFLVGMTLYRNATPWRRIGHQGFTIWTYTISVLLEGRKQGAAELDQEVLQGALASTLKGKYPGLDWEQAIQEGRKLGAAGLESDHELRERALASTLRRIYPGLDWEQAICDAAKYIDGATGTAFENEIFEYLTRRGETTTEAMAVAKKLATRLQRDDAIGGTIIAFTLASIIGHEFGIQEKDLYWGATFRGETASL